MERGSYRQGSQNEVGQEGQPRKNMIFTDKGLNPLDEYDKFNALDDLIKTEPIGFSPN